MKKFEDLTPIQRESALRSAFHSIVENISNGILEIELVDPQNQKDLERILKSSVRRDSPRLAMIGIFSHKGIRKEIERLALVASSESVYADDGSLRMEGK